MAAGDFWRRLTGELTVAERESGLYINPLQFQSALIDIVIGSGMTVAQTRGLFGLAVGTDAGTEFGDFATSANTIGAGQGTSEIRERKRLFIDALCAGSILAARFIPRPNANNPYPNSEALRLRMKALITSLGGTNSGSMAA